MAALVRLVSRLFDRGLAPPSALLTGPASPAQPPRDSLIGAEAPALRGTTPGGTSWAQPRVDGVVVFLTSTCLGCREVWEALGTGGRWDGAEAPLVTVVTPDPTLESRRAVAALAARGVVASGIDVVMSTAAWQDYGAGRAPWVAVVSAGRIAAEGAAGGWADVVALVSATGSGQSR